MELYVHIPFCVKKCNYCDFLSFAGYGCDADETHRSLSRAYTEVLCESLRKTEDKLSEKARQSAGPVIDTVFIGGGTPSSLDPDIMEPLLKSIRGILRLNPSEISPEFTVECNPGTLTKEKLLLYREYGINRLSIGLQAADNRLLKKLGRIHTFEEFQENFGIARKLGFNNINIDLISAVPGQTLGDWRDTLEKTAELKPEHISAYSLILEEGTPLYDMYMKDPGSLRLPDEDTERSMYHETERLLEGYGYKRYEISNYAQAGFECRHNTGYWTGEEYIGLGLGASSYLSEDSLEIFDIDPSLYIDKKETCRLQKMFRIKNTTDLSEYIQRGKDRDSSGHIIEEVLDDAAQISEFCILRLRLCRGFDREDFRKRFGTDVHGVFGEKLEKLKAAELLSEAKGRICLTPKGFDLANTVFCEFM